LQKLIVAKMVVGTSTKTSMKNIDEVHIWEDCQTGVMKPMEKNSEPLISWNWFLLYWIAKVAAVHIDCPALEKRQWPTNRRLSRVQLFMDLKITDSVSSKSIWMDTCLVSSNNSNSFPVVLNIQLWRKRAITLKISCIQEPMVYQEYQE
jgi:hypothetical protein